MSQTAKTNESNDKTIAFTLYFSISLPNSGDILKGLFDVLAVNCGWTNSTPSVVSGAILNLGETISMLARFATSAPLKVTVIEKIQALIPRIHSFCFH